MTEGPLKCLLCSRQTKSVLVVDVRLLDIVKWLWKMHRRHGQLFYSGKIPVLLETRQKKAKYIHRSFNNILLRCLSGLTYKNDLKLISKSSLNIVSANFG
jgi:hypothetical protein